MQPLKVGLVGCSQHSFPGDKEAQYARSVREMRDFSVRLGFDLWAHPRQAVDRADAEAAAAAALAEGVDFLMVQCTSFSAGHLAPVFGRMPGVRLGLWAIEETMDGASRAAEGAVPLNSFCSVNMYASILGHYVDGQMPVKWFYGNAGHPWLDERLGVTVRALAALKNLNRARTALVGGIAPGFDDLYFDERRLLRLLPGLRYNRLHEIREITDRAKAYRAADVADEVGRMKAQARGGAIPEALAMLETSARVLRAFRELVEAHGYDALAVSCWPHFQETFEAPFSACAVVGQLNDDGVAVACEGDTLSAVSMLALRRLSGGTPMLMDLSAFDEADETVLMWHCGPAAACFAGPGGYALGGNYSGAPHEKGKPPRCCGVARDMVFGPGPVTVARLTGEVDRLFLAGGELEGGGKKSFHGSRGWMGRLTLNREPIRVRDFVNTVLARKFQHHFPMVKGDFGREAMELCAWLGIGQVAPVPYQDYLQNG